MKVRDLGVIIDDGITRRERRVEQLLPAESAVHCPAVVDLGRSADTGQCFHCESP